MLIHGLMSYEPVKLCGVNGVHRIHFCRKILIRMKPDDTSTHFVTNLETPEKVFLPLESA